jgi:hypothetical protein
MNQAFSRSTRPMGSAPVKPNYLLAREGAVEVIAGKLNGTSPSRNSPSHSFRLPVAFEKGYGVKAVFLQEKESILQEPYSIPPDRLINVRSDPPP